MNKTQTAPDTMIKTPMLTAEEAALRDAFVRRLFQAFVEGGNLVTIYIGDRLGLYQALAELGSLTPGELATQAGTHERYMREWLEQQAVAGIVEVEDAQAEAKARRYYLSPGHAEVLLAPDSLNYLTPLARMTVGGAQPMPDLLEAFQTGGGVPYTEYGADLRESQAALARTMYLNLLGNVWLPAIPDVHARLQADSPARVADIACGYGWSSLALALAYPKVHIDGFESDADSIVAASTAAAEAGLANRVSFAVRDATVPGLVGTYDLVLVCNAIHDLARPVEALQVMRGLVAAGGAMIAIEPRAPETFSAPSDLFDQMHYLGSLMFCLPTGMAEQPSAATGQLMRPATLRRYAMEAGFSGIEILPIEHPRMRVYRLLL
jgi:2-polyprenyl-3-methyl-5-hydroxy-6-metoxy-1,4-benzoquinol methylase